MYKGQYDIAKIGFIFIHDGKRKNHKILHLFFDDGTDIEVVLKHGFYDYDLNKYILLTDLNYKKYIGHYFIKESINTGEGLKKIKLIDVKIEERYTKVYEVIANKHISCFTNGILSVSAHSEQYCNIFEIDKTKFCYDKEKMDKDIEKYGLLEYDDYKKYITRKEFDIYQVQYFNVAFGKGIINKKIFDFALKIYRKCVDKLVKKI